MKRKTKGLIAAVIGLLLLLCVGGLLILKKIKPAGGFRYLYNEKHPTAGELTVEYHPEAESNAELTPYQSEENKPEKLKITQSLRTTQEGVEKIIEGNSGYLREPAISFDFSLQTVPGIYTFRGNYHRDLSSFGKASVINEKFKGLSFSYKTGRLLKSNGTDFWSGNGWTGQPLIIAWPEETKQIMNLYPDKKTKKDFVEVIYSGMDGYVHFLDLADGTESRDKIHIGMVFKGTASLYPTGIPMLFLGSGDSQPGIYGENVSPRAYIYSLIDGKKLYEFGANDSFAPRTFHAYDSSPVIDAKTDTLFYPGENGILYSIQLNTQYDKVAGTLSIDPEPSVDLVYRAERATEEAYTWGMENSVSVRDHFLYVGDNGGIFNCIDVNTMSIVWSQDLMSDINSSPIYSEEETGNFIYVATTLTAATVNEHSIGQVAVYKLNAANGKIVWRKPFECHNVEGVEGGILATGVLLKDSLAGQIVYSVARCNELSSGLLISLSCKNGETMWKQELPSYAWSSTVTMYAESGAVYLIQCLADGRVLLMNAENGYILSTYHLNATLEATPAVYKNTIVIGTRDRRIVGLTVE